MLASIWVWVHSLPSQFLSVAEEGAEVNAFLNLAIALALVIAAAKIGGYISFRLHQPSVLGELAVGLILGPSVFDFLHWDIFVYSESFSYTNLVGEINQLAEIGVLLLMFIAGLGLHLEDLAKSGKVAVLAGVLGVAFPLAMGYGVGAGYRLSGAESIFIGLVLSATSVSISAQTLMELGRLRTRVGIGMLGAAVFDDILVVLGLSVFFALMISPSGSGWQDIVLIFVRMFVFLLLAILFGGFAFPRLSSYVEKLPVSRGLLAFVFVTLLVYSWLAEIIGHIAPITGAFLAGLLFARSPLRDRIEEQISSLAYGVFVPIFFVSVGLAANVREMGSGTVGLLLVMTVVAVIGKVSGAGLGARLSGFDNRESLQMGVGMMSRGEVGLIVVNQGLTQGLINTDIFSAVVGVVILTTLLTPPILRSLFNQSRESANEDVNQSI